MSGDRINNGDTRGAEIRYAQSVRQRSRIVIILVILGLGIVIHVFFAAFGSFAVFGSHDVFGSLDVFGFLDFSSDIIVLTSGTIVLDSNIIAVAIVIVVDLGQPENLFGIGPIVAFTSSAGETRSRVAFSVVFGVNYRE